MVCVTLRTPPRALRPATSGAAASRHLRACSARLRSVGLKWDAPAGDRCDAASRWGQVERVRSRDERRWGGRSPSTFPLWAILGNERRQQGGDGRQRLLRMKQDQEITRADVGPGVMDPLVMRESRLEILFEGGRAIQSTDVVPCSPLDRRMDCPNHSPIASR